MNRTLSCVRRWASSEFGGRNGFLWIALIPFFVAEILFWSYGAGDPFGMRWNTPPKLSEEPYPDVDIMPRLLKAVAAGDYDLVMVGGSTALPITVPMLREAFPASQRPFPFAYNAPAPSDIKFILDEFAQMKKLTRIVLFVDLSQLGSLGQPGPFFPMREYKSAWYDPRVWYHRFQAFDPVMAQATIQSFLHDRVAFHNQVDLATLKMRRGVLSWAEDPHRLKRLDEDVKKFKNVVDEPTSIGCKDIPFVDQVLRPAAQALNARGISIDLVFPPYPLASYYYWLDVNPFDLLAENTAVLSQVMMLRRCALQATAGLPNIRAHAFDNEDWITSNINNYFDTAHYSNMKIFDYLLSEVRTGSHVITSANFDAFETQLRQRVREYVPDFSNLR